MKKTKAKRSGAVGREPNAESGCRLQVGGATRTKEEYYQHILENRRVAADPENLKCTCTQTLCEWHGRCRECVALHRHYKDHVPACLQEYIVDRLRAVARIGALTAQADEPTPVEHRRYVRERDNEAKRR